MYTCDKNFNEISFLVDKKCVQSSRVLRYPASTPKKFSIESIRRTF